jgi:hypothetical protein
VDPWDSSLYDLILNVHQFTVADAVDFICLAASREQFQATEESQQKMDDLALACQVKVALVNNYPAIAVKSEYGNIIIYAKSDARLIRKLGEAAENLKTEIKEINSIELLPGGTTPPDAV